MRIRRALSVAVLALALAAMSATAALADDGTGGRQPTRGPLAGQAGGNAQAGAPVFTCDGAKRRLRRLNHAIAVIEKRIADGTAKNPEAAAKFVTHAKARAAKIKERIAANCSS